MKLGKDNGLKTATFVTVFWSVFSAAYIAAVTFFDVPIGNERVVDQVLGFIMGTIVATVMNFWLGSSLGSKNKEPEIKEVQNVNSPKEYSTNENIG